MTRVIAIEGPDGAGKSTLIEKLKQDLGREVIHTGGPPKTREEWMDRLIMVRSYQGKPVLFDRLPQVSEQIYGPLYHRDPLLTADDMDREASELQPLIVYCRLNTADEMLTAMSQAEKAHKPPTHIALVVANYEQIVRAYDKKIAQLVCLPGIDVLQYSWKDDDYSSLLAELQACAG